MSEMASFPGSPEPATKSSRMEKSALREWEHSATRLAHDARVKSAKSQYAPIFHANGQSPSARRTQSASPGDIPQTPGLGSYVDTEMARRQRRTPVSDKKQARTPTTPKTKSDVKPRFRSTFSSRTPGEDLALKDGKDTRTSTNNSKHSPPSKSPSNIRQAAATALTFDAESPLGPGSSLSGSRVARRYSRSPSSRLPNAPVAVKAIPVKQGVVGERDELIRSETPAEHSATPPCVTPVLQSRNASQNENASGRPSTGRSVARFLKRRQQLRVANLSCGFTALDAKNDKENIDPAWAEFGEPVVLKSENTREKKVECKKSAKAGTKKTSAPPTRSPLSTLSWTPTNRTTEETRNKNTRVDTRNPEEFLGVFIERATAEAEAFGNEFGDEFGTTNLNSPDLDVFDDSLANDEDDIGVSEFTEPKHGFTSPGYDTFQTECSANEFSTSPPTAASTPSPLRTPTNESTQAWLKEGYKEIRASAAIAAARYAEDTESEYFESETGYGGNDEPLRQPLQYSTKPSVSIDAWDEFGGDVIEKLQSPFKMISPGVLRRAEAESASRASLTRYS